MTRANPFSGVAEFIAVGRHANFRAAGAELGVSASAVSQAIRALEARLGTPLFQRTTRKVALTEAGAALLAQLAPSARNITEALDGAAAAAGRPTGTLRLSVPRIALGLVLWDVLPAFRAAFPELALDLDVNDASVDLTAQQFDAGIRMGEYLERDMAAVRLSEDFRCVVVGSPAYFAARGRPSSPADLARHECIRYRFPTARSLYRWEFVKAGRTYSMDPGGGLRVSDHLSMLELAARGAGLAYTLDRVAAAALAEGTLEEVLAPHLPKVPGLFLYFPEQGRSQPKLRAFIDFVTERLRQPKPRPARRSAGR